MNGHIGVNVVLKHPRMNWIKKGVKKFVTITFKGLVNGFGKL
jgi:hypothetical protein